MASASGSSPPPPAAGSHQQPDPSPTARSSKAIARAPSDPPSEFSSWHDDASSSRATLSAGDRTITVNTQRTRMGEHLKGKLQGMIRQRFDNYLQIIQTLQNDTGKLATLTCEIRVPGDHSNEPRARTSISCNENGTFLVYLLPDAGDLVGMGPGFSRGSSSSSPSGSAGNSPVVRPAETPSSLPDEASDEVAEVASSPAAPANGERELLRRWVTRVCEFGMSGNCHSLTALFRFGYLAWKDWLNCGRPDLEASVDGPDYGSARFSEDEEKWEREEDSNMGSAGLLGSEMPTTPNGDGSYVPLAEPRPVLEAQKHPSMAPLLPMSPKTSPSGQQAAAGAAVAADAGSPSVAAAAASAVAATSSVLPATRPAHTALAAAAAAAADPHYSASYASSSPLHASAPSGPASAASLAAATAAASSVAATASAPASVGAGASSPPAATVPIGQVLGSCSAAAAGAGARATGSQDSREPGLRDLGVGDLDSLSLDFVGEGASASQALTARLRAAKRAMQQDRAEEALGLCTEGLSLAEHVGLHPLLHIGQRSRSSSLNSCGVGTGPGPSNGCSYNSASSSNNANNANNNNNHGSTNANTNHHSHSHSHGYSHHHGYPGSNAYGSSSSSYAVGASASSSSNTNPATQRVPWRPPLCFRETDESGSEIVLQFLELRTSINASLHRFADALSDARELVELQPTMAEGFYWQYVALQGLHRGPEALEALTNALQYDPQNPKYSQLFSELFEHVTAQEGRRESPRSTSRRSTATMEVAVAGSLPSSVAVAEAPTPVVLHRRRPGGSWSRGGGAPRDALSTTTQATHLSSRSTTPTEVSEPLSPHSSSNDSLSAAGARFEDTA